jgi:hypothetical protein
MYGASGLVTWHGLENPTKEGVIIGLWLISADTLRVELTVKICDVEALVPQATGLALSIPGGEIRVSQQPTRYERSENRAVLVYEIDLSPGHPQFLPLELRMK